MAEPDDQADQADQAADTASPIPPELLSMGVALVKDNPEVREALREIIAEESGKLVSDITDDLNARAVERHAELMAELASVRSRADEMATAGETPSASPASSDDRIVRLLETVVERFGPQLIAKVTGSGGATGQFDQMNAMLTQFSTMAEVMGKAYIEPRMTAYYQGFNAANQIFTTVGRAQPEDVKKWADAVSSNGSFGDEAAKREAEKQQGGV